MNALERLLADGVEQAERGAPYIDPVPAVRRASARRRNRRSQLVLAAFVGFVLLLQVDPGVAFGAEPAGVVSAVGRG